MRISDWSSDVCSPDLDPANASLIPGTARIGSTLRHGLEGAISTASQSGFELASMTPGPGLPVVAPSKRIERTIGSPIGRAPVWTQSLMRHSYAVSCLKQTKEVDNTTGLLHTLAPYNHID